MKRLILTAILLMSIGTMAFAQEDAPRERKSPEEMAKMASEMMSKRLSLTEDQKSKIYEINLESFKIAKENREKGEKGDRSAMMASMKERDSQIKAVLNESQLKVYEEMKAERQEHMKGHAKKGKQGKPKKA